MSRNNNRVLLAVIIIILALFVMVRARDASSQHDEEPPPTMARFAPRAGIPSGSIAPEKGVPQPDPEDVTLHVDLSDRSFGFTSAVSVTIAWNTASIWPSPGAPETHESVRLYNGYTEAQRGRDDHLPDWWFHQWKEQVDADVAGIAPSELVDDFPWLALVESERLQYEANQQWLKDGGTPKPDHGPALELYAAVSAAHQGSDAGYVADACRVNLTSSFAYSTYDPVAAFEIGMAIVANPNAPPAVVDAVLLSLAGAGPTEAGALDIEPADLDALGVRIDEGSGAEAMDRMSAIAFSRAYTIGDQERSAAWLKRWEYGVVGVCEAFGPGGRCEGARGEQAVASAWAAEASGSPATENWRAAMVQAVVRCRTDVTEGTDIVVAYDTTWLWGDAAGPPGLIHCLAARIEPVYPAGAVRVTIRIRFSSQSAPW